MRPCDSKYKIFCKLLPPHLQMKVLENRMEECDKALIINKGNGNFHTIKKSLNIPLSIFAVLTWIQGNQAGGLKRLPAIKDALNHLKKQNPQVYGLSTMKKLLSMYYIDYENEETEKVSKNMAKVFKELGDQVSGDEKLFYYTGRSKYVRVVPSKPLRIGLWMYQACISLGCGLPCLVYTKMHDSDKDLGKVVKCHDIIKEWGEMIKKANEEAHTTLFMDSYYLQQQSRGWLKENGIKYLASIHSGRFGVLVDSMKSKVTSTGQYVQCFNQHTKEGAVHYWSRNKNLGRKTVLGVGFEVKKKTKASKVIPMYDHYGSGFSNCDKFNKCIHKKTWPFKLQGDKRVNSNYIFTCILINTYHLWIDSAHVNEDRSSLQWQEFCHDLAFEMISQKN